MLSRKIVFGIGTGWVEALQSSYWLLCDFASLKKLALSNWCHCQHETHPLKLPDEHLIYKLEQSLIILSLFLQGNIKNIVLNPLQISAMSLISTKTRKLTSLYKLKRSRRLALRIASGNSAMPPWGMRRVCPRRIKNCITSFRNSSCK